MVSRMHVHQLLDCYDVCVWHTVLSSAGAHWSSVLVKTGIFTKPGNDAKHPADIVAEDVLEAIKTIVKQEKAAPK